MRQTLRELAGSILFAIAAIGLVLGGISLALAEGLIPVESNPFPTPTRFQVLEIPTSTSQLIIETMPQVNPSETASPSPIICNPPSGWIAIRVKPGDTLASLASLYQTTTLLLSQANCLASDMLEPNSLLYVPPAPTQTSLSCGPPGGWIIYTVRPGDTMYSLSHAYGVSIAQLQQANCMSSGQTSLKSGQQLWVPNVVTRTPRATRTPSLTPVSIIFPTLTSSLTTDVPTLTPTTTTPTGTMTHSPTATQPPTSTLPQTPTATVTSFP
jgi:LysM repeat protein